MGQIKTKSVGLMIPNEILKSDLLSLMEKIVFFGICSLGDKNYESFASNRTLGEFFDIDPRRVSEHIAALKKKGFLIVTLKINNVRLIRVVGKYTRKMRSEELKVPAHLD